MRRGRSGVDLPGEIPADEVTHPTSDDSNDKEWLPAKKKRKGATVPEQAVQKTRHRAGEESWEADVEGIITIVKDPISGGLRGLLAWRSGSAPTYRPMEELYIKCPQLVRGPIMLPQPHYTNYAVDLEVLREPTVCLSLTQMK
jgi:hypothetical protein